MIVDPDAVLERIRNLCARFRAGDYVVTEDLVEAVENMDDWITRHGFLPAEWGGKKR